MFANKKGIFALAGLISMAVCGAATQAATTLQYVVKGHFSAPGSGVSSISTNGAGESNNRANMAAGGYLEFDTQTFTFNDNILDPAFFNGTPKAVSFGLFTSTGPAASFANFGTTGFTLDIIQVVPGAGSGTFVGSANGTIGPGANNGSVLSLIFNAPTTLVLGSPAAISYSVNQNQNINLASTGGTAGIQGVVAAAPTPGVAWAGMALIGAVAAKRRKTSIEA